MITSIQITIDLNSTYSQKIKLSQNELGGRSLYFTLTSSGVMVDLTDKIVVLSGEKPDGTVLFLPCVITNATYGMAKCAITDQFVSAVGEITLQIRIYSAAISGSATSATSLSLYDTTQAFTPNLYAGKWIYIVSGTGAGQSRLIASNTATQIVVTSAWATNPSAGSIYAIVSEVGNSFPFFATVVKSVNIDTQVESTDDFSALQAAISTAAGLDASALHKTGDETKTGGLELTKGIFASGFDANVLPAEKNGVAAYWNATSPLGGVTGGCGRIAAFIKTAGAIVYKALGLGAYIGGKFALLLNADGSAKFGGAVTLNADPTAALGAATKSYVDSDWTPVTETWAYASATTITVPTGAVSRYQQFDKIKFTQSGAVKYGIVLVVADTLLTLLTSATYPVTNVTISSVSISRKATPFGFPTSREAWRQIYALASNVVYTEGTQGYFLDENGRVEATLFGAASGNYMQNTQVLFTLPVNFRPSRKQYGQGWYQRAGESNAANCADININTNGEVKIYCPAAETQIQYVRMQLIFYI